MGRGSNGRRSTVPVGLAEASSSWRDGVRIIGRGLIASSLRRYESLHPDTIAFATGVSDSSCVVATEYDRETSMLLDVLDEASRDDLRVVYFSGGGAIYGWGPEPVGEAGALRPTTAYGRHQIAAEAIVASTPGRHVIVRVPNVIGPTGHQHQLIPALVRQVVDGRVTVFRGAARDLIDVDDMAAVLMELLDCVKEPVTVNLATGWSIPVEEIVAELCSVLELDPIVSRVATGTVQAFATKRLAALIGRVPFEDRNAYRRTLARHAPSLAEAHGAAHRAAVPAGGAEDA